MMLAEVILEIFRTPELGAIRIPMKKKFVQMALLGKVAMPYQMAARVVVAVVVDGMEEQQAHMQ